MELETKDEPTFEDKVDTKVDKMFDNLVVMTDSDGLDEKQLAKMEAKKKGITAGILVHEVFDSSHMDEKEDESQPQISIKMEVNDPNKGIPSPPQFKISSLLPYEVPSSKVGSNLAPKLPPRPFHVHRSSKQRKVNRNPQQVMRRSRRLFNKIDVDESFPLCPTVHECWIHFYMSQVSEDESKDPDSQLDDIVQVGNTWLARNFAYRLAGTHWFVDSVLDCFGRVKHLQEEGGRVAPDKKIWFFPTVYSALSEKGRSLIHPSFVGVWKEMVMIAMPVNITQCHWFLVVFHFTTRKIYVLDSFGKNDCDISRKVHWVHINLIRLFPQEYANHYDIRQWPQELVLENVPLQQNSYDCGAYVCFYMERLRDLVPKPTKRIGVNENFLRIWVANKIGDTRFNNMCKAINDECKAFKQIPENQAKFKELYNHIVGKN